MEQYGKVIHNAARDSLSIRYRIPHSKMRIIPPMENPKAMIDGHTEAVCAGPVNANQKRPIATGSARLFCGYCNERGARPHK
jgi:hypothetical protein